MKEYYSPSDYKQNTWEYEDEAEETEGFKVNTAMDEAYNVYERTYTWDLDQPLKEKPLKRG